MLETIYNRHSGVVTTMAEAILEHKHNSGREIIDSNVQFFLGKQSWFCSLVPSLH